MALTYEMMKKALPQILTNMPADWRGTTFNNSNLLHREGFSAALGALITRKAASGETITTEDLAAVGNAEDYFRVASNISTLYEITLALERGLDVSRVFTFGSTTMPVIAVALVALTTPVHVYHGSAAAPFTAEEQETLLHLGGKLFFHPTSAPATKPATGNFVTVAYEGSETAAVDAVVRDNVLYINNPKAIVPDSIMVIRKRLATPVTTPQADADLRQLASLPFQELPALTRPVADFYAHLQELCGTQVNPDANPQVFTAGLPAICSLWTALVGTGGADILMCSTAYGGSNQLTDVMCERTPAYLRKHTFAIQGADKVMKNIQGELDRLAARADSLLPTTVLFVEIPTNPDMKVPEVVHMAEALRKYRQTTGREVLLLVDTTFAPGSHIMRKMTELVHDLTVMVFISMSKSVSRGLTTAGAIVANHTTAAIRILRNVEKTAKLLGTGAKVDQMITLANNHTGVEERCQKAYAVARECGNSLVEAVKTHASGYTMPLAFVTPEEAAHGFTTSTFSFNLPSPKNATAAVTAGLAQRFVDLLTADKHFKPCVSFGQDNGLVYATVPATSTQGAIKEEDKARQAVGGVQLTRLSFPPTCDCAQIQSVIVKAVATIYSS